MESQFGLGIAMKLWGDNPRASESTAQTIDQGGGLIAVANLVEFK